MTKEVESDVKHPIKSYFVTQATFDIDAIVLEMVSPGINPVSYGSQAAGYHAALIDQYKIYVQMADNVSARRAVANTFFLTINTAVFTLIGVLWNRRPDAATWVLAFPLIALVLQCLTWFWTIRSYRQLNSAKFAVIGAIETLLPVSLYWNAEWKALGEGRDPSRYWPLTHVESAVPLLFAFAYVSAFLAAIIA